MSELESFTHSRELEKLLPKALRLLFQVGDDPFSMLPVGQLRLLRELEDGPKTPGQLAHLMRLTPGAVSQLVGRLRTLSLLEETPDDEDRRVKWLRLSEHCRLEFDKRAELRAKSAQKILDLMSVEAQGGLIEGLRAVIAAGSQSPHED